MVAAASFRIHYNYHNRMANNEIKIYDKKVKIGAIKPNPKNPRVIRGHKFDALVQSIKDFPDMLGLREIVVDEAMMILGGNMRYKACVEAGLKTLKVVVMEGLNDEQKNEFVIKDNANYGQWNWETLANKFDEGLLKRWGMNVWQPDDHLNWSDDEDDPLDVDCDNDDLGGEQVGSSSDSEVVKNSVIQIEFAIGDYDEAYGLATFLRSKGVDLGKLLIQSMEEYAS